MDESSNPCLPECGVARFLALLNGPWATLIVRELLPGPQRFTELRKALPDISPHTLTRRLRHFEQYGIVTRTAHPEVPPRVEYQLTSHGEALREVLETMGAWATKVPEPSPDSQEDAADRAGGRVDVGVRP